MSRKNGRIIGILNSTASGNAKGIWSLSEVQTARQSNIWPKLPGTPTIGTATLGDASASVTFTPPADTGSHPSTLTYIATSNTGVSSSNTASPIVVTGLTNGINVTFTVRTSTAAGSSPASSASNGVTPMGITIASYVVVAGGGAAGSDTTGGGGAGGFRFGSSYTLPSTFTVTVGAGGSSYSSGSNSVFDTVTSTGGGSSSAGGGPFNQVGNNGGSGGGSPYSTPNAYGLGNTPATSPSQGNNGGPSRGGAPYQSGGGGGAAAVGGSGAAPAATGGDGGAGAVNPITGSTAGQLYGGSYYLAGGGGGCGYSAASVAGGTGGLGGGGTGGGLGNSGAGVSGTVNTGGGGGGHGAGGGSAGSGGSGVVIISYPTSNPDLTSIGGGLTYAKTTSGANTIYTFTAGTGTVTV